MPLALLDGKNDLLRLVLAWLTLRDRKALSAVNRYTAYSELRQLVFAQSVLRLPPLQYVIGSAQSGSATTTNAAADARKSFGRKKRSIGASAHDAVSLSDHDAWTAYYGGTFLRRLDPQLAPFIQRVLVPLSMAPQLLALLQFAPKLQRVGFWHDAAMVAPHKHKHKHVVATAVAASLDVRDVGALATVEMLDLSAVARIFNLDAVAALASSLRSLDLSGTNVSDVRALGVLQQLEVLDLRRTRVADLAFVEALAPRLQWLNIADTRVQDFTSLAHLQQLAFLDMSRNWVADASPLQHLAALRTLKLCNSGSVGALELVLRAPELTALHMHDTALRDLAFVRNTPQLVLLDVRRTGVEADDLQPLAALPMLETLRMDDSCCVVEQANEDAVETTDRHRMIAQWASQLTRLSRLQIEAAHGAFDDNDDDARVVFAHAVDGAALLAHLPALAALETPALADFDAALQFASPALQTLVMHSWHSKHLQQLALAPRAVAQLQSLTLTLPSAATIVELHPLAQFTNLSALVLVDAVFEDLAPLGALTQLRTLDVSLRSRAKRQLARRFQHVQTFDFLRMLSQLEVLTLDGRVDLRDAVPLAALPRLRRLSLEGSKVATLAPLLALHRLEALNVAATPVASTDELLQLLRRCTVLEELRVPEKLDCAALQRCSGGARLRFLGHRDVGVNCLWTNHHYHDHA